ncbi:hypothetical protein PINS_up005703 [Pythium insidiosum]|nr:hypothetical protein PINS_up005703 [Pythium insidiosum]
MTIAPVHYLQLVEDAYRHLERCWTRFLPQVQAMIFELCCESYYMDESIVQEDWSACLMASRVPSVAFLAPEPAASFSSTRRCSARTQRPLRRQVLAGGGGGAAAATASSAASGDAQHALPVRVLEFDFERCQIALSDGSFRPSAFAFSVQLPSRKKYFESDVTFAAIHENFIAPQCVRLKQASAQGSESASAFAIWDSTIDPRDDREVTQLYATLAICRAIIPGHALPDELLDAIRDLHMCFTASARPPFLGDGSGIKGNPIDSNSNGPAKRYRRAPKRWAAEKARVAAQLLPFYLELFLSAAASPELLHATPEHSSVSSAPPQRSSSSSSSAAATTNASLLPRLVRALAADIVHMARHVDDATVTGLVHHLLHAFVLRSRLPSAMVRLVDALFLASHHFRTLFLRAGGVTRLWNAMCAATRPRNDNSAVVSVTTSAAPPTAAVSANEASTGGAAMPVRPVSNSALQMNGDRHHAVDATAAASESKGQRRSSLFGIRRKSHVRASRTVDRNSALLLSMAAHDGHAPAAHGDVHANAKTPLLLFVRMDPRQVQAQLASALKESYFPTAAVERPVWQSMTSLVLHVAEMLLSDPAALTWERDVMATLRLDGLFDRLHSELVRGSTAAHVPTTTPEIDMRGRPVDALDRVTSFVSNSAASVSSSPSSFSPPLASSMSSEPHETRLRTAIECVGALYRLEVLRRRHASTVALGEKRYWYLFHVLPLAIARLSRAHARAAPTARNETSTATAATTAAAAAAERPPYRRPCRLDHEPRRVRGVPAGRARRRQAHDVGAAAARARADGAAARDGDRVCAGLARGSAARRERDGRRARAPARRGASVSRARPLAAERAHGRARAHGRRRPAAAARARGRELWRVDPTACTAAVPRGTRRRIGACPARAAAVFPRVLDARERGAAAQRDERGIRR